MRCTEIKIIQEKIEAEEEIREGTTKTRSNSGQDQTTLLLPTATHKMTIIDHTINRIMAIKVTIIVQSRFHISLPTPTTLPSPNLISNSQAMATKITLQTTTITNSHIKATIIVTGTKDGFQSISKITIIILRRMKQLIYPILILNLNLHIIISLEVVGVGVEAKIDGSKIMPTPISRSAVNSSRRTPILLLEVRTRMQVAGRGEVHPQKPKVHLIISGLQRIMSHYKIQIGNKRRKKKEKVVVKQKQLKLIINGVGLMSQKSRRKESSHRRLRRLLPVPQRKMPRINGEKNPNLSKLPTLGQQKVRNRKMMSEIGVPKQMTQMQTKTLAVGVR